MKNAECIADALGQYGSKIDPAEDAWTVVISAPPEGPVVSDLLSALKACLDENEIPSVRVTLEDQSYVMES